MDRKSQVISSNHPLPSISSTRICSLKSSLYFSDLANTLTTRNKFSLELNKDSVSITKGKNINLILIKLPYKLIPTSVRIFSNSGNIAATRNIFAILIH